MSKFPISYISLCVNFAFILNTLHCDAYRHDSVVKFMQLFEATCVRNLLIVKNLEHRKFQVWYHVKEESVLSVPYILKIMSRLLWPHETLLQTSVTNIQNQKVADVFSDGVIVSGHTA